MPEDVRRASSTESPSAGGIGLWRGRRWARWGAGTVVGISLATTAVALRDGVTLFGVVTLAVDLALLHLLVRRGVARRPAATPTG